jgi:hypothetical protein
MRAEEVGYGKGRRRRYGQVLMPPMVLKLPFGV